MRARAAASSLRRWTSALALLSCAAIGCSIPSAIAPTYRGSVGAPNRGFLTDAVELPKEGKGFAWKSAADRHYGLPRMIDLIEEAAGKVKDERPSSMPLYVADISAKGGGSLIPKHASHRTGRDVDLLFYMTTLEGAPIAGSSFVVMGPDGIGVDPSGRFVRFDTDREWLLIRSIVESKKAHVQWIFVARILEALLVEHAIALGEPTETIAIAEQVMKQPGDSLPHDDHIHVRLSCEPGELTIGCTDAGPRWAWLPTLTKVEASSDELVEAMMGPSITASSAVPIAEK